MDSIFNGVRFETGEGNPLTVPSGSGKEWSLNEPSEQQILSVGASMSEVNSSWSSSPYTARKDAVLKFAELIQKRTSELAGILARESGKPLWESTQEIGALAGKVKSAISAHETRLKAISYEDSERSHVRTDFKPHGTVLVIGPYNFPVHMANGHIVPALLAGNTTIFKPSELGVEIARAYVQTWAEAFENEPCPVAMVSGGGWTAEFAASMPTVKAIFFTGSSATGLELIQKFGHKKLVVTEMGGDTTTIIDSYSKLDSTIALLLQSCFLTAGQRCTSTRHLAVVDTPENRRLIDSFKGSAEAIKTKMLQQDNESQEFYGPLRTSRMLEVVGRYHEELLANDATSLLRPELVPHKPRLITPGLVVVNSRDQTRTSCGEVLGPVITIQFVDNLDQGIDVANDSEYGLACGLISDNEQKFEKVFAKAEVGALNWNEPTAGNSGWASFGGIKASGNYRPSGYLAADFCAYAVSSMQRKTIRSSIFDTGGIDLNEFISGQ